MCRTFRSSSSSSSAMTGVRLSSSGSTFQASAATLGNYVTALEHRIMSSSRMVIWSSAGVENGMRLQERRAKAASSFFFSSLTFCRVLVSNPALGRAEDQLETEFTWTCVTSGGQEADELMRLAATCADVQLNTATKRTKYILHLQKQPTEGFCLCVFVCVVSSSGQERSVWWGTGGKQSALARLAQDFQQADAENQSNDNKTPLF